MTIFKMMAVVLISAIVGLASVTTVAAECPPDCEKPAPPTDDSVDSGDGD